MEFFSFGIGKDALILNKILGLKLTCMKDGVCKAGFLVKSVEKYIETLNGIGNSYVIYTKEENGAIEEIYRFEGNKIYEEKSCMDCNCCSNKKETEKDILERVKQIGKQSN